MSRNFPSAYFLLCFAAAIMSGCGGKSFTDILANPTAQEAAVLNAPPLIIPPDFLERPLIKPPAWRRAKTKQSAQTRRPRPQEESSAVPKSLTKLPAPNTSDTNATPTRSPNPPQSRTAPPPPLNP